MATMVDDLLRQLPIQQLAAQLGVDPVTAEQAARDGLPALLGGLSSNVSDHEGRNALAGALERDHDGSLLDHEDVLSQIDANDGDAIVGHIFGANRGDVVQQLGGQSGRGDLMQQLLPLLAPMVLAWLSKRVGTATGAGSGQSRGPAGGPTAGGLGDILGDILGQQRTEVARQQPETGGLFDMLDSVLAGRSRSRTADQATDSSRDVPGVTDVGDVFK